MASSPLTLYVDARRASPYALSVFVSLTEKGLPFEVVPLKLSAGEQFKAPYLQRSLTGKVPTLVHGDFSLSESSAIDEYLEEVFSPPQYKATYPRDRLDRARARQIQAWLRSDLVPLRTERITDVIFFGSRFAPLTKQGQQAADSLLFLVDSLLPADASNLFGDWCLADTELALMLNRLVMHGDPVPERLAKYASTQWQRPPVQAWMAMERRNE